MPLVFTTLDGMGQSAKGIYIFLFYIDPKFKSVCVPFTEM